MTKFKSLLLVIVAAMAITSCGMMGPSTDQAVEYNDNVILRQIAIMDKIEALEESFDEYIPEEMDAALDDALNTTDEGIKYLEGLEEFGGSFEFRDHSLTFFKVYKGVLDNEYSEMVEIYKLPTEEYTEAEQERWGDLREKAWDKIDEGLAEFNEYQETFATKYNFIVVDDKF